jgi:methenyltetrahydrofolate cyclohydrolase
MDRQSSINKAFMQAAEVPLNNAMMCKQALGLAQLIEGKSNLGAVSDLDVAINLANAAVSGCRANVEINLPLIKDRSKAEEIREALNTLF